MENQENNHQDQPEQELAEKTTESPAADALKQEQGEPDKAAQAEPQDQAPVEQEPVAETANAPADDQVADEQPVEESESVASAPEKAEETADVDTTDEIVPEEVSATATAEVAKKNAPEKTGDQAQPADAETEGGDATGQQPDAEPPAEPKVDGLKWYVVHTYSGFENKAKEALKDRIRTAKKEKYFGEVLIPQENVVEIVKGKKRTTSRKFFPGYILVNMLLDSQTWYMVKNTPKITGFVGGSTKPAPIPEEEVRRLSKQITEGTLNPRPKVQFEKGDSVRVIDGPFNNFNGVVDEVKPDKGKLRVLVSIFGRSTPIELDFIQVEKN